MVEKRLTKTARHLRRNMTEAEKKLWSRIRSKQIENSKFVRQFPIGGAIGDFACRSAKLIIELDGGQHADSANDESRTRMIEAHGYTVIRFWNNEIFDNLEGVLESIAKELRNIRGK